MFEKYTRHVEFLGEDLDNVHQSGLFGSQVLHLAAFKGIGDDVLKFLCLGADVNAKGDLGLTPLHYAVLGGQVDVIELLLSHGADDCVENEFSETPFQMAKIMGSAEMQELLKKGGLSDVGAYSDGGGRQRWIDFKNIQELNFPANWPQDI